MRYIVAAAILAAFLGGAAFGLAGEAEAEYRIGFARYRLDPAVVDLWTTTDNAEKARAKAARWAHLAQCHQALFDSTGGGDTQIGSGGGCEGEERHIIYAGGDRSNHPGARGFTHSSGDNSNASGGNPKFTDVGILDCLVNAGFVTCTFDQLVTYHTNNSLGGY